MHGTPLTELASIYCVGKRPRNHGQACRSFDVIMTPATEQGSNVR